MVQQEVKLQSTSVKEPQASQEKIRKRAYELYCARNGAPGDEMDDWLKAEAELRVAAGKCPGTLENGSPCQQDLIGKDEPLIHHAEGEDGGGFTHHSCKLGHAWHRYMGDGLLTPCDCTGHARSGI